MTREELARFQLEESARMLFPLAMTCRRRFLRSADLLEIRGPAIDKLRQFGFYHPVDLEPLMPSWKCMCERYLDTFYDPQMNLFHDHETHVKVEWDRFVHWKLIPELVREDSLVRNVLRALEVLPCQSPEQAANAVHQHFLEMTLPAEAPPWAPEETID